MGGLPVALRSLRALCPSRRHFVSQRDTLPQCKPSNFAISATPFPAWCASIARKRISSNILCGNFLPSRGIPQGIVHHLRFEKLNITVHHVNYEMTNTAVTHSRGALELISWGVPLMGRLSAVLVIVHDLRLKCGSTSALRFYPPLSSGRPKRCAPCRRISPATARSRTVSAW